MERDEHDLTPPHDILAEQSVLGSMMLSHDAIDDVTRIMRVSDFYKPAHGVIYSAILSLYNRSEPADAITVVAELARSGEIVRVGGAVYIHELISVVGTTANVLYHAKIVKDAADRRALIASLTRGLQLLNGAGDTAGIIARVASDVSMIDAGVNPGMGTFSFEELMATPDEARPWVLPAMMRAGERCIFTGPEGMGKSVLVSQLCMGAASGVATLTPGLDIHEPRRVLMLDAENDRLQIKANARKIWPYVRELKGNDAPPTIEWVDVRYIDLSDPVDQQRLVRLARDRKPELMYLGSLYRLAPAGDHHHQQFDWVTRTIDRIRAETGTAILMEAHMGHGMQNDRNGGRPRGASEWMGWPEFGIGMHLHRDKPVELRPWRGARSDDRDWPGGLRRGTLVPWMPISADEWAARYAE
jgi:DnaB-like helicase N terminal domain/AAA domain